MSDRYGLSADPYFNEDPYAPTPLVAQAPPVRRSDPSAVSHWQATRCPYAAGGRKCGAPLVTIGLVTTCPISLSHYTRVRATPEEERRRGAGKIVPKLPGRA